MQHYLLGEIMRQSILRLRFKSIFAGGLFSVFNVGKITTAFSGSSYSFSFIFCFITSESWQFEFSAQASDGLVTTVAVTINNDC